MLDDVVVLETERRVETLGYAQDQVWVSKLEEIDFLDQFIVQEQGNFRPECVGELVQYLEFVAQ